MVCKAAIFHTTQPEVGCHNEHYIDVIMTTMASQITSLTVVYSIVYSGTDERKNKRSASLAFVQGIHRDRWIPRTKGQLRRKCFHLMTSSWWANTCCSDCLPLQEISLCNRTINNNRSFLVLVMDWCAEQTILSLTWESPHLGKTVFILRWGPAYPSSQWILSDISRVSCKKGPTRHAYASQIGPFLQDTLDIFSSTHQSSSLFLSIMPSYSGHAAFRYAYLILAFTNTSRQPIHQNGASTYWQLFFSQTIEIRINSLLPERWDNNFEISQRSSCEESVPMSWCHHAIKV